MDSSTRRTKPARQLKLDSQRHVLRYRLPRFARTSLLGIAIFTSLDVLSQAQTLPRPVFPINIPATPEADATAPSAHELPPPHPIDVAANPAEYPQVPAVRMQFHPRASTSCDQLNTPCDQMEPACAPAPLCPPPKKNVHHVFIQPPAQQQPSAMPQQALQQQLPPGAFVAPPQSGTVVSEQSPVGVSGLRLRIPALTLELPSIELPHIFRRGRAAQMELDSATATYVAGAGVSPSASLASYAMSPAAAPAASPAQYAAPPRAPSSAPRPTPSRAPLACDAPGDDQAQAYPQASADPNQLQRDYDELQQRCARLEQLLIRMQNAQMQLAPMQCPQPPAESPYARDPRSQAR